MHSCVTSKNVKWCHLIWPTLYTSRQLCEVTTSLGSSTAYSSHVRTLT